MRYIIMTKEKSSIRFCIRSRTRQAADAISRCSLPLLCSLLVHGAAQWPGDVC
jgi:hypothetical protein